MYLSTRFLEKFDIVVPEGISNEMEEVRRMRNLAAHGRKDPTKEDVISSIASIERFERFLDSLDKEEVKQKVQDYFQERKKLENQGQPTDLSHFTDI